MTDIKDMRDDTTTVTGGTADDTGEPVDPTTSATKGECPLSVVIITENEADQIADCIKSVFVACRTLPAFEVILVDSASTDRTVDIAREYPITILRIPDAHTVSCGAGRFVGDQVARGELVLHVDGDMTLTDEWLPQAIDYLQSHSETVGVEGWLDRAKATTVADADAIGGVTLYDAEALADIGGFDPFLRGYEDIDVGFRLTTAGKRLVTLPSVSAIHNDEQAVTEPIRRLRQGYFLAPGQAIRKHYNSPAILRKLVTRQQYKLSLLAWIGAGVVSLISLPLVSIWLLGSIAGVAAIAHRRGVLGTVDFLGTKLLAIAGVAAGLRRPPQPASAYPLSAVEVVATGRVLDGSSLEVPADAAASPPPSTD